MPDMVDVMLAKALSSPGQISVYANRAKQAVKDANAAAAQAQAAIDNIDSITQEINENKETSEETLAAVNATLNRVEGAVVVIDESIIGSISDEVDRLLLSLTSSSTDDYITKNLTITYPSDKTASLDNIIKMYKSAGLNEDGTMTQKAIKEYVDSQVSNSGGSSSGGNGTSVNFGTENSGKMLKVGETGYAKISNIEEKDLVEALIRLGTYTAINAVGVENDYENRTYTRVQDAVSYTQPSNYNSYSMYGGRMRCNVDDNGAITAFYGDSNYKEDGSNGQVMVYQPKFYYQRIPTKVTDKQYGEVIRKETVVISDVEQTGFKLHPLFITPEGEELDYVLISAYEGGLFDADSGSYIKNPTEINYDYDKLSSVADVKPVNGFINDFTLANAERIARNRGEGWHITNMAVESANQMLGMIEYNTLNAQGVIGLGISSVQTVGAGNCSSYTGSTASLGNITGSAVQTTNEANGVETTYTEAGYKAISYRGMENPYGNNWRYIGDVLIHGDGTKDGGEPYICNSFNYSDTLTVNYSPIGFTIPSIYGWISGFGYGNEDYDWVFMPTECAATANSAEPVGDNLWSIANLNATNMALAGGTWAFGQSDGPFFYACDKLPTEYNRAYSARLMFVPTKNYTYQSNILKWNQKMGG